MLAGLVCVMRAVGRGDLDVNRGQERLINDQRMIQPNLRAERSLIL